MESSKAFRPAKYPTRALQNYTDPSFFDLDWPRYSKATLPSVDPTTNPEQVVIARLIDTDELMKNKLKT